METVPSPSHIQSPINYLTRVILIENISTPNQNNITIKKTHKKPTNAYKPSQSKLKPKHDLKNMLQIWPKRSYFQIL
jgi:hypothetical protein